LTNSSVISYLETPYAVVGINPRAKTTFFKDGRYITVKTTDVTIDRINGTIHVHVDIPNCTGVSVWVQPKRSIPFQQADRKNVNAVSCDCNGQDSPPGSRLTRPDIGNCGNVASFVGKFPAGEKSEERESEDPVVQVLLISIVERKTSTNSPRVRSSSVRNPLLAILARAKRRVGKTITTLARTFIARPITLVAW